jgi:hypothetical protein
MAGFATLASTVGAPITHTYKLDAANATTGLLLDFINDSGMTCLVRLGLYFVTAATTPKCVEANIATTATAGATLVANTQTAVATTVFWSTLVPVFYDTYHLSVWAINTGVDAGIDATGIVGYAVVELWPVCAVV